MPPNPLKLTIDAGGTHLRGRLIGVGELIDQRVSSRDHDLIEFIEGYLSLYPQIDFIGISFAGPVYKGKVLSTVNLKVSRVDIKGYFESHYPVRLEIDNDLNCAIIAESAYFGSESIAALYVGTGLGAAVIDGGRLIRGYRNGAFEIGHIPYKKAPFACGCGRYECIENFASGIALQKWLTHIEGEYSNTIDLQTLALTHPMVENNFKEALLDGLAILVTLANPKIVVLGGGVITSNPSLIEWLRAKLPAKSINAEGVEIHQTNLHDATLIGAALLETISPYN